MLLDDPALRALKQKFDSEKVKKEGIVKSTDRGFGFLETSDRESFFITPNNMRSLMHGDKISAVIETDDKGKSQAVPEKLVEPVLKRFVGRASFNQGKMYVTVDSPTIKNFILCEDKRKNKNQKIEQGDWLVCSLTSHAMEKKGFKAIVKEFITTADDPKAPWTVSLRRLDLPLYAPESDKEFTFNANELEREDLTALPFVTIDSEKTLDMDDALYIQKDGDNFILYVAIADPTAYIAEDSELDKESARRAFSIYLPGRDIPMLPRALSEDLCSLKYNEVRAAIVAKIPVTADGTIECEKTVFSLANIKSQGKLIYNYVSDYIENCDSSRFNPDPTIKAVLDNLVEFTKARDSYRSTHCATFKNRPDYDFVLTEDGALDHIEVNTRRIANQIVEESMITANIAAGTILAQTLGSGIFNIHKGFDFSYKKEIAELLEQEHVPDLTLQDLETIEGFSALRRFAMEQNNNYLDGRIRRLQEYSQISNKPGPHFALGTQFYATWTSPIRKYGDMINHRLIKSILLKSEHPKMPDEETLSSMNMARRLNRSAERDVKDWLYVDYLYNDFKNGTAFKAEVIDIMRSGVRATLIDNGAFIFIPASTFATAKDDVEFKSAIGVITAHGNVALKLGDTIDIKIIDINKATRSIVGAPLVGLQGVVLPDPTQNGR